MKKRRLRYVIFAIIVIPFLIINLTLIVKTKLYPNKIADFMGYKPFIVLSGSMETSISVGDLVIVKQIDAKNVRKNDIIAFRSGDIVITHRVKDVYNNENSISFKTKGDNNNTEDDFIVNANELEGIYVTKIPGLGKALMFLSKPLGILVVVLFIIVIAGVIYFITFKPSKKDEELMKEFEEYKKNKELCNKK